MKDITFITGNKGKARQLEDYLNTKVVNKNLELFEIQSLNVEEVIHQKLNDAYAQIMSPIIVDDVSLVITAMGKLPGPFIKYFLEELGTDGICKMVALSNEKKAIAKVCIGYKDSKGMRIFSGEIKGVIANEPKGEGGFGWDSLFIPDGYTQTRASMSDADYDATSPRKTALNKLEKYLLST